MAHDPNGQGGVDDPAVQAVAERALELIFDGAKVGLGSGPTAGSEAGAITSGRTETPRVRTDWRSISSGRTSVEVTLSSSNSSR